MENRLSGLAREASRSQGSGEASAARGGDRKGKKIRAPSPILVSEGREAAGTETTSAWTGKKKTKNQSAPTSGDLGGTEQIEGLDWDEDYLKKEIDCYLKRLHEVAPYDPDVFLPFDEQQLEALNKRLAQCRIKAYEGDGQELDAATFADKYPTSKLEQNDYYKLYENRFEWYFDPQYCEYADIQDYQRLVLRDNGEYEDWENYYKTCSKLEGDQQFVQLWDELSSNQTKLIELYLSDSSGKEPRIERLLYYHALKIAARLPHVSKTLVCRGFEDFIHRIRFEDRWYKYYAGFFFEMWQLITKQKMNFTEALRHIHEEDKYGCLSFAWERQLKKEKPNLYMLEQQFKPYLDCTGATAKDDEAYSLIMDSVKDLVMKTKTYYDYAKKKLHIAKEIGLIP